MSTVQTTPATLGRAERETPATRVRRWGRAHGMDTAVVVALTIYGELRSISKAVNSIPPLRWLDSLGRE